MKRESFQSRLGFLLVTAGCAIGIGNVWRFPFVAGQNGGGIFVILYLIFLLCMGVPVLTMELAVGRASRKSAVLGYKALEKPGSKWHIHGWFCIFRLLYAHDVLHDGFRMDAELFFPLCHRNLSFGYGCHGGWRCVRVICCWPRGMGKLDGSHRCAWIAGMQYGITEGC